MLPERRKSAEEIAKLRESMGVPGAEQKGAEDAPRPTKVDASETNVFEAPAADEPLTVPAAKPVRSLRKSEQRPIKPKRVVTAAKGDAPIPVRRHSDKELMEMRRVQVTPPEQVIAYVQQLALPLPFIIGAYLLPLLGAFLGWFAAWSPGVPEPDFFADWVAALSRKPWLPTGGFVGLITLCVLGLAVAGWIGWKKPRSRHHAGFICIIAVLVSVFGIIHQFTPTYGP